MPEVHIVVHPLGSFLICWAGQPGISSASHFHCHGKAMAWGSGEQSHLAVCHIPVSLWVPGTVPHCWKACNQDVMLGHGEVTAARWSLSKATAACGRQDSSPSLNQLKPWDYFMKRSKGTTSGAVPRVGPDGWKRCLAWNSPINGQNAAGKWYSYMVIFTFHLGLNSHDWDRRNTVQCLRPGSFD